MGKMSLLQGSGNTKELAAPVAKDGVVFAGTHLLVDLWGATNLNSSAEIEQTLINASRIAGATVLYSYLHPFEPHGVSGVVVLAESHISIHTWPERNYAAIDIFMCGKADPYKSIDTIKAYFQPESIQLSEMKRGVKV